MLSAEYGALFGKCPLSVLFMEPVGFAGESMSLGEDLRVYNFDAFPVFSFCLLSVD